MSKINLLDDRIINRIAAGEVVENPASVIKELVENSIDAGATSITIDFSKGGTESIRIIDNGSGMDAVDAKTAFIRHATSKISSADDLDHIATMGFRGEALASISEVSRIVLTTSTGDEGTRIIINGGVCESVKPIGFPRGTTIEVSDLFFNTPARKKFLKSSKGETTSILELCQKFILSHPEVSFRVVNNGRVEMSSSADKSLLGAICTVYSEDARDELFATEYTDGNITVNGYVSKPAYSQANRRKQSFFVNGRYVKSALIASALDEAYKGSLMINKYPWAILNVTLPFDAVDVNVHPQKTEVRFADSRSVFNAVVKAVSRVLLPETVLPELEIVEDEPIKPTTAATVTVSLTDKFDDEPVAGEPKQEVIPTPVDVKKPSEEKKAPAVNAAQPKSAAFAEKKQEDAVKLSTSSTFDDEPEKEDLKPNKATPTPLFEVTPVAMQMPKMADIKSQNKIPLSVRENIKDTASSTAQKPEQKTVPEQITVLEQTEVVNIQSPEEKAEIIGTLWDTYIICKKGDACYIIDQHAAHERYLFDKYLEEFNSGKVLIQQLLIPEVIEAEPFFIDIITENADTFAKLGFDVEAFGNRSCIIRGVPSIACEAPFKTIFDEAVELIKQNASTKDLIVQSVSKELMRSACKHAVKGNQKLSQAELEYIVNAISQLKGLTCPHGRPIAVVLTKKELEKRFGRIQ